MQREVHMLLCSIGCSVHPWVLNAALVHVGVQVQGANFLWAGDYPDLAADAGNCSIVQAVNNIYRGNYAGIAGGVVYSTDKESLWLNCTAEEPLAANSSTCLPPEWINNTVGAQGYGPSIAFLPALIRLELLGTDVATDYVNGAMVQW